MAGLNTNFAYWRRYVIVGDSFLPSQLFCSKIGLTPWGSLQSLPFSETISWELAKLWHVLDWIVLFPSARSDTSLHQQGCKMLLDIFHLLWCARSEVWMVTRISSSNSSLLWIYPIFFVCETWGGDKYVIRLRLSMWMLLYRRVELLWEKNNNNTSHCVELVCGLAWSQTGLTNPLTLWKYSSGQDLVVLIAGGGKGGTLCFFYNHGIRPLYL